MADTVRASCCLAKTKAFLPIQALILWVLKPRRVIYNEGSSLKMFKWTWPHYLYPLQNIVLWGIRVFIMSVLLSTFKGFAIAFVGFCSDSYHLIIRQCMFDMKIGAEGSVLQELCLCNSYSKMFVRMYYAPVICNPRPPPPPHLRGWAVNSGANMLDVTCAFKQRVKAFHWTESRAH